MKRILTGVLALLLIAALIAVLVPSSMPMALGEELPVYRPVTLAHPDPDPIPPDAATPYAPHADGWLPLQRGYEDGTISVRIEPCMIDGTICWLAWVQIADASQIRTTSWRKYPSKQEAFVTAMAEREQGVLTINGDWCVSRSEGVVIRNGKTLRKARATYYDCMTIDANGDMHVYVAPVPNNYDDFDGEILHSFVFGPALVKDGEMLTDFNERGMRLVGGNKKTERMVLCQMDTLSYLVICTEGPDQSWDGSGGFTIPRMAEICHALGAKQAFNLDGGSSAWLVLGKDRLNAVEGKKRTITDAIVFITAEP